jgi:hypothetical protein
MTSPTGEERSWPVYRHEPERRWRRRIAAQTPSLRQCGNGGTLTLSDTGISDNSADAGAANAAVERHDRACPTGTAAAAFYETNPFRPRASLFGWINRLIKAKTQTSPSVLWLSAIE